MRKVQVTYILDDTVCQDVEYTDGPVNVKIHRKTGAGYVKLGGQRSFYRRIERIRVTEVAEAGEPEDMR